MPWSAIGQRKTEFVASREGALPEGVGAEAECATVGPHPRRTSTSDGR